VLFLWLVGKVFGKGVMTASVATIVVTSLTVLPAIALAHVRGGRRVAWIAAALYVVTPSLVLFGATSMDGVFAVLPVTGVWLFSRALAAKGLLKSLIYACVAGAAFTGALFLTYAVALLGLVYAIYLLSQLRFGLRTFARVLLLCLVVLMAIVLAHSILYWITGYDPLACLRSAINADASVMAYVRRHRIDASFANLMAFIIGAGVVSVVAWWHTIARQVLSVAQKSSTDTWDFSLLLGLIVTAFIGWFTRETERIWLFLIPLVLIGAATTFASWRRAIGFVVVLWILITQTIASNFFLNTWW
jgi:hypothetical protein